MDKLETNEIVALGAVEKWRKISGTSLSLNMVLTYEIC